MSMLTLHMYSIIALCGMLNDSTSLVGLTQILYCPLAHFFSYWQPYTHMDVHKKMHAHAQTQHLGRTPTSSYNDQQPIH